MKREEIDKSWFRTERQNELRKQKYKDGRRRQKKRSKGRTKDAFCVRGAWGQTCVGNEKKEQERSKDCTRPSLCNTHHRRQPHRTTSFFVLSL